MHRNISNPFRRLMLKMNLINPEVYELKFEQAILKDSPPDQHGGYFQIPANERGKIVVSVIRDPYTRFMSMYNFRWWEKYNVVGKQTIDKDFPEWPNLDLPAFIRFFELDNEGFKKGFGIKPEVRIGNQTIIFMYMFYKDPLTVFKNLTNEYLESDAFKTDIADVEFLRQENLSNELGNFLARYNFSEKEVNLARNWRMLNVSKPSDPSKVNEHEAMVKNYVRDTEKLLYQILEWKGFKY